MTPQTSTLNQIQSSHRTDAMVILIGLLALLAWDASTLDLTLIRAVGSPGGFGLRDAWWLAGVLGLGVLFGWAQMVRGAHYASHTLWSAWICWTACALLNALVTRPQAARVPVASPR